MPTEKITTHRPVHLITTRPGERCEAVELVLNSQKGVSNGPNTESYPKKSLILRNNLVAKHFYTKNTIGAEMEKFEGEVE